MIIRFCLTALLVIAAPSAIFAQPTKKSTVTAAMPAPNDRARHWLTLVDDKNYAQSWNEAGAAFKARQTADAWTKSAADTRGPLGAMASRDLRAIDLSRSNVAVIHYDTVFAHKAAAQETITLAFENGSWAVTDYAVK
jgi:hypothetical protein